MSVILVKCVSLILDLRAASVEATKTTPVRLSLYGTERLRYCLVNATILLRSTAGPSVWFSPNYSSVVVETTAKRYSRAPVSRIKLSSSMNFAGPYVNPHGPVSPSLSSSKSFVLANFTADI